MQRDMFKNYKEIIEKNNTIETERLLLRPFRYDCERDFEDFFEYRKGPEIILHQGGKLVKTMDDAREVLDEYQRLVDAGDYQFFIEHKELECLIGGFSLVLYENDDRVQIGYEFGVNYWGFGYATEVLGAVIDYIFAKLGANRIEGFHYGGNEASGNVMKKCGMTLEGISQKKFKINGILRDDYAYAILR